jgi:hypothetical protein
MGKGRRTARKREPNRWSKSGSVRPSDGPTDPSVDRRIKGAISSYRGYRLQALYGLSRLLTSPSGVVHPESIEDLSILDAGQLIEAVQVKALASPLTLSDLDPGGQGSFFQSAATRFALGGAETLTVATIGPLGTELAAVASGDLGAKSTLRSKLIGYGIAPDAVDSIVARLRFDVVAEVEIKSRLTSQLRDSIAGFDPDVAFDLLTLWLYLRSEQRVPLSAAQVRDRLLGIGEFLADRATHHAEWFTTIVPIADAAISESDRARLADEFYQGVAVRYEHVAAGLAVERTSRIAEIDEGFAVERVVIVHSASGQGKTTLAYEYMSRLPEAWRFAVRAIEDRTDALRIARAIAGHAHAMDLPLFVHVDVNPRDTEWSTLVRELVASPQVRVLVTIREEDWRRSSETWSFPSHDVDPALSRDEASDIYDGLRTRFPDAPPTFAEAWHRFGGAGPLLEFVHLVTQRQDLAGRLRDQIQGVRTAFGEEALGVVAFLRYVSVATASGARARVRPLADLAGLRDPAYVVERLEREYLIRLTDDRSIAAGLHPVRSRILADLLTDPELQPRSEVVAALLPAIPEEDLETVLLDALEAEPEGRDIVLAGTSRLAPRTWTGVANVGRALRWRGIADYAEAHRSLIEEADPGRMGTWAVHLRGDIADAMPGTTEELWETIARIGEWSEERVADLALLRSRQRPGREAFELLRVWLDQVEPPSAPPGPTEWASVGEVLFFAQYLEAGARLIDCLEAKWLDEAVADAPIEDLADLSFGLGGLGLEWRSRHRASLADAYRSAVQGIGFEDDGNRLRIDFVNAGSASAEARATSKTGNWNREAVARLDLLRRLFPDRERYASQGWGHRTIDEAPTTQSRTSSGDVCHHRG